MDLGVSDHNSHDEYFKDNDYLISVRNTARGKGGTSWSGFLEDEIREVLNHVVNSSSVALRSRFICYQDKCFILNIKKAFEFRLSAFSIDRKLEK